MTRQLIQPVLPTEDWRGQQTWLARGGHLLADRGRSQAGERDQIDNALLEFVIRENGGVFVRRVVNLVVLPSDLGIEPSRIGRRCTLDGKVGGLDHRVEIDLPQVGFLERAYG